MKVYHSLSEYQRGSHPVATIGTFDGVHIGHQTILRRIVASAREREGEAVLLSFHPHPRLVLFPENNPLRLLQTQEEKIASLAALGIDKVLFIPFTKEFSRTPSKSFIWDILSGIVGIEHIIIGYDHHFGKNRTGGIEELTAFSAALNYSVEEIPAQAIDDASVSSTKIRLALERGDVQTAKSYLGYAYTFAGTVVQGAQLGRTLGFPTANIALDDTLKLIPADGVYVVSVDMPNGSTAWGLLSIGTRPTVGNDLARTQEVWLFDFEGDLYGKPLRVHLQHFLRPDMKFDSLETLVAAMNADKAAAAAWIAQQSA